MTEKDAAVNHSGDSDSTGAVTGNVLGAYYGYDKIDDKWKKRIDLYNIDDDSRTIDEALNMLELEKMQGIKNVIFTPPFLSNKNISRIVC